MITEEYVDIYKKLLNQYPIYKTNPNILELITKIYYTNNCENAKYEILKKKSKITYDYLIELKHNNPQITNYDIMIKLHQIIII